jgi:ribonuclease HI
MEIDCLSQQKVVSWSWIRGHSGNIHNERADVLAKQAIARIIMDVDI